jgi:CRP/FNR family transcriptional regulator
MSVSPDVHEKYTHLAAFPDLSGLDDPVWAEVVHEAMAIAAPRDVTMLCKGDPCQNFLLLSQGSLRVQEHSEDGREIVLYRVRPGDICVLALTSLVDEVPYGAEAVTETEVAGLALSHEQFQRALAGSAGFRRFVLSTLARRLRDVMLLVEEIAFRRLDSRLACTLYQMFDREGGDMLRITHQELAKELGTTREVASRLLKDFEQKRGAIRLHRGAIELVNPGILAEYARRDVV